MNTRVVISVEGKDKDEILTRLHSAILQIEDLKENTIKLGNGDIILIQPLDHLDKPIKDKI